MGSYPWYHDALAWIAHLPVQFAYRIIWLMARLGSGNARDVHQAMWNAGLSIPPLNRRAL